MSQQKLTIAPVTLHSENKVTVPKLIQIHDLINLKLIC